jgi:NTE family protein
VQLEARDVHGKIKPYLPSRRWIDGSFSQDLPAKRLARMYGVNHFIVSQVLPGLGRETNMKPGIRKIISDASVAATKQAVRGWLDFVQHRAKVGPRLATAMEALNAVIDQQFKADVNIVPGFGDTRLLDILKLLEEEEMAALLHAGERATWPKLPVIGTTTRIGRTLDGILHDFEVDEAHWLRSAPRTEAASGESLAGGRKPVRRKAQHKQRAPVTVLKPPSRKSA